MPREVEAVRRALRTSFVRLPLVFARGTPLVVGFSGGQDSTCLLHAIANAHRNFQVLAVHVDHGLRPDSADAARQVAKHSETMGVPCRVIRVHVAKRASVQHAARQARYEALRTAATEHGASAILVAHTADDQAETLLLNLLRGTGLLGLAGMRLFETAPQHENASLVRPLLGVERATTLAYCKHFGLPLVEDASNQTRAFTRNRVRLDVLPMLEQFNPAIREVLARTADLAAADIAVLDQVAADVYASIAREGDYDLAAFRDAPRALQRRVLRLAFQALGIELQDVGDRPIEDALNLLQTGEPNQTYHLPYGVELGITHDHTFRLRSPRSSADHALAEGPLRTNFDQQSATRNADG
jgi:tRNA(Ile)-lysidine synthase